MKTANTYLPIFPGFYGTSYEPDESNEISGIEDERKYNGLSELENLWNIAKFDYEGYRESVGKSCVTFIFNILVNEMKIVKSIKFQSISSPREYNFANDSINIEVKFTEKQAKKIKSLIVKNFELFDAIIKENFTSYDGFISFYSNDSSKWLNDLDNILEHQTQSATILEFLLLIYVSKDETEDFSIVDGANDLGNEMCGFVLENNFLSCINYEELTTKEYCKECESFVEPTDYIIGGGCCKDCVESGVNSLTNPFCNNCKSPILNNWYKRSIVTNVMLKNLTLDKIFCSECLVLQN